MFNGLVTYSSDRRLAADLVTINAQRAFEIIELNKMIKAYADSKGFTYCDYHPALAAADGLALKDEYCLYDRLHPNPDAYTVMEGIIKPIIDGLIR